MKIPIIQGLVEKHSIEILKKAEMALVAEEPLPIEVVGDDEGEQLTHIIAASWILKIMDQEEIDFKTALKEYTRKVRESIS